MALEAARQAVASGGYSPARWEGHRPRRSPEMSYSNI
jgi:hypothetical protein